MRGTRTVGLSVVFLIGCAVGGATSQYVAPPARAGTNLPQWEYTCLFPGLGNPTEKANELGAQGWELAAGAGAGAGYDKQFFWCFKRSKT
jgi:hypothetical protein